MGFYFSQRLDLDENVLPEATTLAFLGQGMNDTSKKFDNN
jgi:hypothetical protein